MLTVVGILNINHSQKPLFLLGTFVQDLFSFVDETPRKFTWCFRKAKQVYCIHHANVQGTYKLLLIKTGYLVFLVKFIHNRSPQQTLTNYFYFKATTPTLKRHTANLKATLS